MKQARGRTDSEERYVCSYIYIYTYSYQHINIDSNYVRFVFICACIIFTCTCGMFACTYVIFICTVYICICIIFLSACIICICRQTNSDCKCICIYIYVIHIHSIYILHTYIIYLHIHIPCMHIYIYIYLINIIHIHTWKRTFDAILRSGVAVLWSQRLAKVKSVRAFGARFDCPCFNGRVQFHLRALQDLPAQFAYSPRLLSLPAFN